MSPLLIFILVVLFIVSGLLLLRDTAFLKGKPTDTPPKPADSGSGDANADKKADLPDPEKRRDGFHD